MSTKRFVLANFKMNKNLEEYKKWIHVFLELLYKFRVPKIEIGCAPSFPYISFMKQACIGTSILVGAQNFFPQKSGAFTGEVSISQLKDLQVDFVIIGHSERRKIFGESDQFVSEKLKSAIENDILPVFCIGETKEEREKNITFEILKSQLKALDQISLKKEIVIAYEPVWAIGTGIPAKKEDIKSAVNFIKNEISEKGFKSFSVLYGGSIDESVAESIKDICDGGLVGSASLDPQKFFKIAVNFE